MAPAILFSLLPHPLVGLLQQPLWTQIHVPVQLHSLGVIKYDLLTRLNESVVENNLKLPKQLGDGVGDLHVQVLGKCKRGGGKEVDHVNGPRLGGG